MSTIAFSAAAQEAGGDRDHETRGNGHDRPQVWFNLTNYTMGQGVDGPEGWRVLGAPDARWPEFMSRIQVLAAAGIWQTPDDVLGKTLAKLKDKRAAFAMESLAQSWVHEPPCGHGVESYYDPPGARKTAEKIQAAGGRLDVVAMDEPLWWGRYYGGSNACHSAIDNVAERAAAIMHEYQVAFPDVEIGDIEPIPALTNQPNWRAEYADWMDAFYAKTGKRIAFLQIDINWGQPNWREGLREAVSFARARHLPFGIIYNANMTRAVASDQLWLDSAKQNIVEIEDNLHIMPDQAIFHSWDKFPRRSITDQAGPGEDRLVEFYLDRLESKGRER